MFDQMTIDDYCDAAIEEQKLNTDSALARLLHKSPNIINCWRTKRSWPTDETMVELAILANMEVTIALLDLNIWRAKGKAIREYREIKSQNGWSLKHLL